MERESSEYAGLEIFGNGVTCLSSGTASNNSLNWGTCLGSMVKVRVWFWTKKVSHNVEMDGAYC